MYQTQIPKAQIDASDGLEEFQALAHAISHQQPLSKLRQQARIERDLAKSQGDQARSEYWDVIVAVTRTLYDLEVVMENLEEQADSAKKAEVR